MRRTRFVLPLLVGALALGACSDDGPTGGSGRNRLTIQLTDAPGDLKEAWVKVEKIVLVRSGTDTTGDNRLEIKPKVTGFINLLTLSGGKLLDLADTTGLSAGTYTQLRIFVDEAYIRTNDNRVFATAGAALPAGVTASGTLRCPSCSQSGFKVFFTDGGLTVAPNSVVVLDFDAGQSFGHEAGRSGQWIMRPTIRATAKTIAFGTVKGTVSLAAGVTLPACGGAATTLRTFKPFVRLGADTLSAAVDSVGAFRIANVTPGTYATGYHANVTFTNGNVLAYVATPSAANVTVAQRDSATVNYSVTAAVCR